jgi:chemotaxis protein MotB
MRIGNQVATVLLVAMILPVLGAGCKTLDEYRQLEMSLKTMNAEKAQVEADLYDCRSVSDNLRTKLASNEAELQTKGRLADNLQQENDRLAQKADEMARIAEQLAKKGITDPVVIERKLPPELDTALRDFASQYPGLVAYDKKHGTVKWSSDLLFALGSDVVKDTAKESLAKFAEIVGSPAAGGFDVIVTGHTDNLPIKRSATAAAHPTNWHLSAHRAISVEKILQDVGVDAGRLAVMGCGEYRPIDDNSTEDGRAQNRRVEIYIVPQGSVTAMAGSAHRSAPGVAAAVEK